MWGRRIDYALPLWIIRRPGRLFMDGLVVCTVSIIFTDMHLADRKIYRGTYCLNLHVLQKGGIDYLTRISGQVRMAGGNCTVQQLPHIAGSYLLYLVHLHQKGNPTAR